MGSVKRVFVGYCDICGKQLKEYFATMDDLIYIADMNRWFIDEKTEILKCPRCLKDNGKKGTCKNA